MKNSLARSGIRTQDLEDRGPALNHQSHETHRTGENDRFLLKFFLSCAGVDGLLWVTLSDGSGWDGGTERWQPDPSGAPGSLDESGSGSLDLDSCGWCDQNLRVVSNFCRAFSSRFLTESNFRRTFGGSTTFPGLRSASGKVSSSSLKTFGSQVVIWISGTSSAVTAVLGSCPG